MLNLEDLPALLYEIYKHKRFVLYTSQMDAVKYAQKYDVAIGESS